MQIITRAAARTAGLKRYRDGSTCKHGHDAERYVSTGACVPCNRRLSSKWAKGNSAQVNSAVRERYATSEGFRENSLRLSKKSWWKRRLERPWLMLLYGAGKRARKAGIDFALDEEWAKLVWTGRCALTGIAFDLSPKMDRAASLYSASIDRIRPELGYMPGNCRFILYAVNAFRGAGTDAQMYEIATELSRNKGG